MTDRMTLYQAGKSDVEIADILGTRRAVICSWRHNKGLPIIKRSQGAPRRGPRDAERERRVISMTRERLTYEKIGEIVGVSRGTVAGIVWRAQQRGMA